MSLIRQNKESYGAEFEKHLFEQYKLYVEMADRISARRMLANSFFVGVHTALITAFTVLLKENDIAWAHAVYRSDSAVLCLVACSSLLSATELREIQGSPRT